MVAPQKDFPLIAELLAEQQKLATPVVRFSSAHDQGAAGAPAAIYRDLIPLEAPRAGEQYAFEVDLDACTGCKACVSACHSLNGLDDQETWRDVGVLVGGSARKPFTQTVTTACHHCADPACLNGCPVLAYEKDPVTGIVRHLDDQCIGCQYCVLKCPYDVPKYSDRLGIVRKCDMCHGRLAEGEAPACAQACPTHAIRIVTVAPSPERPITSFLPTAPDPAYTQPTTRYLRRRALPENVKPADAGLLRPQPPHWPLALMLILLPLAVAGETVAAIRGWEKFGHAADAPHLALAAWLAGTVGLVASVFHLGQPRRAWRIFLGWRQSWLSREALAFGAWWALGAAALLQPGFLPVAVLVGGAGLVCSVMVYVDTRRQFWRRRETVPRLFGSAILLALAPFAPRAAAALLLAKLAWEARAFFRRDATARLQRGPLGRLVLARDLLGVFAAVALLAVPGWTAWLAAFAGEVLERHLFFRAVDAPKMPGMPA